MKHKVCPYLKGNDTGIIGNQFITRIKGQPIREYLTTMTRKDCLKEDCHLYDICWK